MRIDVNGSRSLLTRKSTTFPAPRVIDETIGPIPKKPNTARISPSMPDEKLSISISKPGLTLPSQMASIFFISQPPSGPMIMAPRNIGTSAPVTTPIVAIAPTTAPRVP